ncbi:MAG: hypothetical protein AABX70_02480 [Nanoarchaeota archaeon]
MSDDISPAQPLLGLLPASRNALSELVDELWIKTQTDNLPLTGEKVDASYRQLRSQYSQALTVAEIIGHKDLGEINTGFLAMQRTYATHVKEFVEKGRQPIATVINGIEKEVGELTELRTKKAPLLQKANTGELDDQGYEQLRALSGKIRKLETAPDRTQSLRRQLEAIDLVVDHLDQVLKFEGLELLDYRIPPSHEILEQISQGTYRSIPFEPIGSGEREAQSIFGGDVVTAEKASAGPLQLAVVAPELQNIILIKRTVDAYTPGDVFLSGKVTQDVMAKEGYDKGNPIGAKFAGSYLERAAAVFGVKLRTKEGGRLFVKNERYTVLDDPIFFGRITEHINPQDAAAINEFYLRHALGRIWLEAIAYDGFRVDQVMAAGREDGWPLTSRVVSLNFTKFPGEYDVEQISDPETDVRIYRRRTVEANERQVAAVREAVKCFGSGRFTDRTLAERIVETQEGYTISTVVIQHVLGKEIEFLGLKLVTDSPPTYQKSDRPASAAELRVKNKPKPGKRQLV